MGQCKLHPGFAKACGRSGGTFGVPMPAIMDADDINRLWCKRLHQRSLSLSRMVEWQGRALGKQGMDLDPIDWIGFLGFVGVIVLHPKVAPPARTACALKELHDRVATCQPKGQVCRHALIEPFGLVMDHPMNIAKARPQKGGEQLLGQRQDDIRINMQRAGAIGACDGMGRGPIGKGRQRDDLIAQTLQHFGYGQKVDPGRKVLSMILHNPDGQNDGDICLNPGLQLMRTQAGKLGQGRAFMMSWVWA